MNSMIFQLIGALGLLIISIGIIVQKRKDRDEIFIIGGILLLIYSIYLSEIIFIISQCVFILSAIYDLVKKKKNKK